VSDPGWWAFELPELTPGKPATDAVFPASPAGLDYRAYLSLNTLLGCQSPLSAVPDERAFIVTHQLIELVFKLVIFDLAVIARTMKQLAGSASSSRELESVLECWDFWRPALTASSRVRLSCKMTLPLLMRYVGVRSDGTSGNFDRVEFFRFREKLGTASGMQSAQFRLIQRAFGKSPLLDMNVFPKPRARPAFGHTLMSVTDPSIVPSDGDTASPKGDSILADVARVDDLIHDVLTLYSVLNPCPVNAPISAIDDCEFESASTGLDRILARTNETHSRVPPDGEMLNRFRSDLRQVIDRENARRKVCAAAAAGAGYLKTMKPGSHLVRVLARLASADRHLHGRHRGSLLSTHLRVARNALHAPVSRSRENIDANTAPGTGGATIAYLGFMRRHLIPLFPALIAFQQSAPPQAAAAN